MEELLTEIEIPQCYCGSDAKLKASWSDSNPGRRFYRCEKFGRNGKDRDCGFFRWFDPPVSRHRREVINKVLRKLLEGEELYEIEGAKGKVVVWFIVGVLLGYLLGKL